MTTQNQAIDNTTGATTEEKNAAKDLVLKAKEKAYQDILNAQQLMMLRKLKIKQLLIFKVLLQIQQLKMLRKMN
ncbi:DUF1542 domain-containing protein [Staphylococcus aureus]